MVLPSRGDLGPLFPSLVTTFPSQGLGKHLRAYSPLQVGVVGDPADGGSGVLPLDWSEWVAEFLQRLLFTLQSLEPVTGATSSVGTFLVSGGSMYRPMLKLLFARLTLPLYEQVGKRCNNGFQNSL